MLSNRQNNQAADEALSSATDSDKEALLDAFRTFLEQGAEATENPTAASTDTRPVDLYTLFCELTELKNEVKLEARQFKTALQQLQIVTEQSELDRATFLAELERNHKVIQEQQTHEALKPTLMHLLDLNDRLYAGLIATATFKPGLFTPRREIQVIHAQRQGQALTLKRLQQILSASGVLPIKTTGLPFDPHQMSAVEIESRQDIASGVVTKELRKGFIWGDEVLRTAEVQVNKV